jgi:hypothetical protein
MINNKTVALAIGFWITLVGCLGGTMAKEEVTGITPAALVLGQEPLAEKDVLATLDIVSTQDRLGGQGSLRVKEGEVTVGTPLIYALKEPTKETLSSIMLVDQKKYNFFLVVFRYTFRPPPKGRRYEEINFRVVLADSGASAFRLIPKNVVQEVKETENFDIGFIISLQGENAANPIGGEFSAKAARTVQFTHLRPVITALGIGEKDFSWQFKGQLKNPVDPGSHETAAVIQVPKDAKQLSAIIKWDIKLKRNLFDAWRDIPVTVETLPFDLFSKQ